MPQFCMKKKCAKKEEADRSYLEYTLVQSNADLTKFSFNICIISTGILLVWFNANLINFTFNICIIFRAILLV